MKSNNQKGKLDMVYQKNYLLLAPEQADWEARKQKAKKIISIIKDFLDSYGGMPISQAEMLEIGCSAGGMSEVFAKHFKYVTATDIDTDALKIAKSRNVYKNVQFQFSDSMELIFKKETFDIVICNHVYEHVSDAKKLMQEIYRVLKPGGICYFSGPNKYILIEPHYSLPFLSWFPKKVADYYVRLFDKGKLYYESPLSYSKLRKISAQFQIFDYTVKVVKYPKRFSMTYPMDGVIAFIPEFVFYIFLYNMPSFFWILKKNK